MTVLPSLDILYMQGSIFPAGNRLRINNMKAQIQIKADLTFSAKLLMIYDNFWRKNAIAIQCLIPG